MNVTHGIYANDIDTSERIDHAEDQGSTKEPDTHIEGNQTQTNRR